MRGHLWYSLLFNILDLELRVGALRYADVFRLSLLFAVPGACEVLSTMADPNNPVTTLDAALQPSMAAMATAIVGFYSLGWTL